MISTRAGRRSSGGPRWCCRSLLGTWLLLASCGPGLADPAPPSVAPEPSAAPAAAPAPTVPSVAQGGGPAAAQETSRMESPLTLVLQICDTLSQGPVVAAELAGRLGALEHEGRSAVYAKPTAPAFKQLIASRDRTSGETRSLELILAPETALVVAELTRTFGAFGTPPKVSWDSPTRLTFTHEPAADRPRRCVIAATLVEGATASEQAQLASLTIIPEAR